MSHKISGNTGGREGLRFRHGTRSALGRITAAGWMTHGGMGGWRDLGRFAAAYIVKGKGIYQDERTHGLDLGPGSLVFTFPGMRQYYRPDVGTEWTEFFLIFEGPVIDLWESQGLMNRQVPVIFGLKPVEIWSHRFEAILGSSGALASDPPLVEICRLQSVLAEAICHRGGADDDAEVDWVRRAKALLEIGLYRQSPLEEVAAAMGMPAHAFRRKFGELVGESPVRYRAVRTIDCACELMQSTDKLDKQIALELGFCDEFYFSRRFKEITGKSPKEFRAEHPSLSKG